jgi:hypothetical protein
MVNYFRSGPWGTTTRTRPLPPFTSSMALGAFPFPLPVCIALELLVMNESLDCRGVGCGGHAGVGSVRAWGYRAVRLWRLRPQLRICAHEHHVAVTVCRSWCACAGSSVARAPQWPPTRGELCVACLSLSSQDYLGPESARGRRWRTSANETKSHVKRRRHRGRPMAAPPSQRRPHARNVVEELQHARQSAMRHLASQSMGWGTRLLRVDHHVSRVVTAARAQSLLRRSRGRKRVRRHFLSNRCCRRLCQRPSTTPSVLLLHQHPISA